MFSALVALVLELVAAAALVHEPAGATITAPRAAHAAEAPHYAPPRPTAPPVAAEPTPAEGPGAAEPDPRFYSETAATDSPMCVPDAPELVPAPPFCWEP